jgi:hypothetical protein
MNRDQLKQHINNFRLNLPQGMKFAVIAQSSAVLESSKDLHCEYLYVAMERAGHHWALQTYGEMETRLEGTWTGNSWLKVYPCYNEEHLVMVDGIPCQYVGETNPFQDDPMLERPVPNITDFLTEGSQPSTVRKMADILKGGMTEKDGFIEVSPEAIQAALRESAMAPFEYNERSADVDGDDPMEHRAKRQAPNRSDAGGHDRAMRDMPRMPVIVAGEPIIHRLLKEPQVFANKGIIIAPPSERRFHLDDSIAELAAKGPINEGYLSDLSLLLDSQAVESRSASKSLLRNPISLKDTPYGGFQAYRRTKLGTSEYRARKLVLIEEDLKFTDDEVNNRRRLNNASLYLKVLHKRAVRGLDRALDEESMTARCTQPIGGHIEPEDHTVDSIGVALGSLRELKEEGEE